MKIALQDIAPPIATLLKEFKKIILTNGSEYFPHDISQNEYHEIVLIALEKKLSKNNYWNIISRNDNAIILEHVTRSRNIFCTTSDALNMLHHSSYTLNENSEIIPINSKWRAKMQKEIIHLASNGYKISGISIKNMESKNGATTDIHNGIFIGIVINEFVLLPNASGTVDAKQKENISIKIFSKELLPTCKAIARQIGVIALDDFCITSNELQSMNDFELTSQLLHLTIFAEMNDLDRKRVTRLLEQNGHELCDL